MPFLWSSSSSSVIIGRKMSCSSKRKRQHRVVHQHIGVEHEELGRPAGCGACAPAWAEPRAEAPARAGGATGGPQPWRALHRLRLEQPGRPRRADEGVAPSRKVQRCLRRGNLGCCARLQRSLLGHAGRPGCRRRRLGRTSPGLGTVAWAVACVTLGGGEKKKPLRRGRAASCFVGGAGGSRRRRAAPLDDRQAAFFSALTALRTSSTWPATLMPRHSARMTPLGVHQEGAALDALDLLAVHDLVLDHAEHVAQLLFGVGDQFERQFEGCP